jgi:pimeloyl-ACP methyl ester carboxylesterase
MSGSVPVIQYDLERQMPKALVNGIELYYETHGGGEPLLLIAGFACDLSMWSDVVGALAGHHRVIVFDNRGVGRSSAPDSPYTIRGMAGDAAALLDAIGVGRVHVAGYSMGGQIAQELALARPGQVQSLMLLSCCVRCDERNKAVMETWGELPGVVEPRLMARLLLPWLYSNAFFTRPGAVEQLLTLLLDNPYPPTPQGIYRQSRALGDFDTTSRLRQIRCPTLVLVGKEDVLLPVAFSQELAQAIAGAELVVMEKAGHGLVVESPAGVAQAMLGFLSRTRPVKTDPVA